MTTTRPRYLLRRAGVDRYAEALNPFNRLSWPIRLRLVLIVPWRSGWNRRVRDWTACLEGYADFEDETTTRRDDETARPAFTVGYNEAGSPRPVRVCDCWLLPTLPSHRSECGYYTPPVVVPLLPTVIHGDPDDPEVRERAAEANDGAGALIVPDDEGETTTP